MNDLERRQRRLDRARMFIHAELVVAVAVPLLVALLHVAGPGQSEPMFWVGPLYLRLLPWAAFGGMIIGLVLMVRLSRPDPEGGDRTWRFRDVSDLERRRGRLARAHTLIRFELLVAIVAPVVAVFLNVAAPGFPGDWREPSMFEQLLPLGAIAGTIVGFVWMVRLSRVDPEAGERTWRYRDF